MLGGLHVRYYSCPCMGLLEFSHYENEPIKDYLTKKTIKVLRKSVFRCSKCGDLVSVVLMPSYEQYVLMRKIKVSDEEFERLGNKYKSYRR